MKFSSKVLQGHHGLVRTVLAFWSPKASGRLGDASAVGKKGNMSGGCAVDSRLRTAAQTAACADKLYLY